MCAYLRTSIVYQGNTNVKLIFFKKTGYDRRDVVRLHTFTAIPSTSRQMTFQTTRGGSSPVWNDGIPDRRMPAMEARDDRGTMSRLQKSHFTAQQRGGRTERLMENTARPTFRSCVFAVMSKTKERIGDSIALTYPGMRSHILGARASCPHADVTALRSPIRV